MIKLSSSILDFLPSNALSFASCGNVGKLEPIIPATVFEKFKVANPEEVAVILNYFQKGITHNHP